jgi:hypothetical protein
MSIHNEVSNEIAVALLAGREKDPEQLKRLKEVVFKIHEALQGMTSNARTQRHRAQVAGEDKKGNR